MGLSDDVAIVALVVSLIALGVSYLQLFQQILAAVQGLRYCSSQVIGPWKERRQLRLRLLEARLELTFQTPKIVVVTPLEMTRLRRQHPDAVTYMMSADLRQTTNPKRFREVDETVHGSFFPDAVPPDQLPETVQPSAVQGSRRAAQEVFPTPSMVQDKSQEEANVGNTLDGHLSDAEYEKFIQRSASGALSKHNPRNYGFWIPKTLPVARLRRFGITDFVNMVLHRNPRRENEVLATWLRLMFEIHSAYAGYWPKDCTEACNQTQDSKFGAPIKGPVVRDELRRERENDSRAQPAAVYCQWSWDFMPDSLIRPVALIDVGDVVILVVRLGMTWRGLNPSEGVLAADGNGYSLSASVESGLGLVLRFNAGRDEGFLPALIPSRAVDKLICGIVPGDADLVREDFDYIEAFDGGKPQRNLDAVLTRIGITYRARATIVNAGYREVNNELIMLLCPFLPLQNSRMVLHSFSGWEESMIGVVSCWEGRTCLHRALAAKVARAELENNTSQPALVGIRERLDNFRRLFPNDYFVRRSKRAVTGHHHPSRQQAEQQQVAILIFLREAFEYTTKWFLAQGWQLVDAEDRTMYLDLVASHICLSFQACASALEKLKSRKETSSGTTPVQIKALEDWITTERYDARLRGIRERYDVVKAEDRGEWVSEEVFEKGLAYVHAVENWRTSGIWNYILEKHRKRGLTQEMVEEAWWMLMLRGIVWSASTNSLEVVSTIPANFYGDKTPLWIT